MSAGDLRLRELLVDDVDAGFADLVHSYSSVVYSLLLRLTGSDADADDLGQESFLRAYKALQGFPVHRRAQLEPKPWLMAIATNVWRNHLRDRSRRPSTVSAHEDE